MNTGYINKSHLWLISISFLFKFFYLYKNLFTVCTQILSKSKFKVTVSFTGFQISFIIRFQLFCQQVNGEGSPWESTLTVSFERVVQIFKGWIHWTVTKVICSQLVAWWVNKYLVKYLADNLRDFNLFDILQFKA